jgi:hypothetical protein
MRIEKFLRAFFLILFPINKDYLLKIKKVLTLVKDFRL